tara:strand:- start:26080 stop:27462 length:1383 start_codon:yes stop_codon:yes gene_type:complete
MKALEFARRVLFWTADFIKGGNVRKHFKDIKFIQGNPNSPKALKCRNEHLERLLEHAVKSVPYYKDLMGEHRSKLEHFPIVDKTIIRENYKKFTSGSYLDKHKHEVSTSGSTGNPFKLLQNKGKRERNIADTIFFSKRAGFELGARLYYLRLWDKQYKKSGLLSKIQNIDMQSVDDLNDKSLHDWIARYEKDGSTKNILAYNSALRSVCQYLNKINAVPLKCKTNSVIAMAEGMDDYVRQGIKRYFNIEPLSRYSNSENGIIGQQFYGSHDFEINEASYYVEILDLNRDIPVKSGESGRIVITDLFNYCMPMIRYDTGDVGKVQRSESGRFVFTAIEGRKMDMFTNTDGEFVSSHIIHHILQFEGIDQFQFVEEDDNNYTIKLKVNDNFDLNNESKVIEKYKVYFGENAQILVEYVSDIPLLLSGKRKLVINNAINKQNAKKKMSDQQAHVDRYDLESSK